MPISLRIYPIPLHSVCAGAFSIWLLLTSDQTESSGKILLFSFLLGVAFSIWTLWGRKWSSLWFLAGLLLGIAAIGTHDAKKAFLIENRSPLLVEDFSKNRYGKWILTGVTAKSERWSLQTAESISVSAGSWIDAEWSERKSDPRWFRDRSRMEREKKGGVPKKGKLLRWGEIDLSVEKLTLSMRLKGNWISFRSDLLNRSKERLSLVLGEKVGGAALAVVLGERKGLDEDLAKNLRTAGTFHLFAISGMHLAILSNLLMILLRVMGFGTKGSSLFLIALLWIYAFLCGLPLSVQRASLMATASLSAPWFARKSAPMHSLTLAALLILLLRPDDFGGPAFLLSFGATSGIIAWNNKKTNAQILPDNPLVAPITISLSAFCATLPILAHFFNQANPWTLLANLPSCPMMALFFGSVLACAAIPRDLCAAAALLSDLFGASAQLLYHGLEKIAFWASEAPGGLLFFERWPLWVMVLWYIAYFALSRWGDSRKIRRVGLSAVTLLLLYWSALPYLTFLRPELRLDIIDIGQGDALLLRTPNRRSLLIDTGQGVYGEGNRLVNHLRSSGGRPDLLMITHPHADHWGGVFALAENGLLPRHVILPKGRTRRSSKGWERALKTISESGAQIDSAGSGLLHLDKRLVLRVSQPGERGVPVSNANDLSLVLEVGWGEEWIVLTGDLENKPEIDFARRKVPGKILLFKAGHHGSANATQAYFLDRWKPEEVVISCGQPNRYKHPTPAMLGRVAQRGIPWKRTDEEGTLRYRWIKKGRGTTSLSLQKP